MRSKCFSIALSAFEVNLRCASGAFELRLRRVSGAFGVHNTPSVKLMMV